MPTPHDLHKKRRSQIDCLPFASTIYIGIRMKNFDITGVPISHFPQFIRALAMVKKAAALANNELGYLSVEKKEAIVQACDEIIVDEAFLDEFPVDLIQGGAGTSTNMNANEVIANRGLEIMGKQKGQYEFLHPNNDVNQSQSTNDVYPTAARLAMCFSDDPLIEAVKYLIDALDEKSIEFSDVLKLGRTQLQDAVPMTLGQEFKGWADALRSDVTRMDSLAQLFHTINLGGTAIGTSINTDPNYTATVIRKLSLVSGIELTSASNMIDASSDMGDFLIFSGMLRRLAVKLSKLANDLRLLSSGPRGGFNDINLPAVQPGSSMLVLSNAMISKQPQ
jgi:aspartate ammonia-lyase